MNSQEKIIKTTIFKRILFLVLGCAFLYFTCATNFLSGFAQHVTQKLPFFPLIIWQVLIYMVFGGIGVLFLLNFFMPSQIKITEQYIQGPFNVKPVLWSEIEKIEYSQIQRSQIVTFYLKKGSVTHMRIFNIFPTKKTSFSLALSNYPSSGQKILMEEVEKHTTVA